LKKQALGKSHCRALDTNAQLWKKLVGYLAKSSRNLNVNINQADHAGKLRQLFLRDFMPAGSIWS
jgi:hypothetical protein